METHKTIQYLLVILLSIFFVGCNGLESIDNKPPMGEVEDNSGESTSEPEVVDTEETVDPGPWFKLSKPTSKDSPQVVLSRCTALGQRAKKFGINHFLIAFEGLASFNSSGTQKIYAEFENNPELNHIDVPKKSGSGGFMLYYLIWPTLSQTEGSTDFLIFPETSVEDNQQNSQPEVCARAWLQAHPKGKLILSGHSYGGHAANQLADILEKSNTPIHSVITVDPRTKGYRGDLGKTSNTEFWVNYYQTNTLFLNGYKVEGADDNVNLSKTGISHGKIPGRPEIQNMLLSVLEE